MDSADTKKSSPGKSIEISLDSGTKENDTTYKLYPSRWGVVLTVVMFNLSNNCLWISFGAVGTKAAEFYEVEVDSIDWLSSIFLYVGIPTCFALTWINEKLGLR